jgi:hypothetical protein
MAGGTYGSFCIALARDYGQLSPCSCMLHESCILEGGGRELTPDFFARQALHATFVMRFLFLRSNRLDNELDGVSSGFFGSASAFIAGSNGLNGFGSIAEYQYQPDLAPVCAEMKDYIETASGNGAAWKAIASRGGSAWSILRTGSLSRGKTSLQAW